MNTNHDKQETTKSQQTTSGKKQITRTRVHLLTINGEYKINQQQSKTNHEKHGLPNRKKQKTSNHRNQKTHNHQKQR